MVRLIGAPNVPLDVRIHRSCLRERDLLAANLDPFQQNVEDRVAGRRRRQALLSSSGHGGEQRHHEGGTMKTH